MVVVGAEGVGSIKMLYCQGYHYRWYKHTAPLLYGVGEVTGGGVGGGLGYKDTVPCLQSLDLLVLDLTVLLQRLLHQALQSLQAAATITVKTSVYAYTQILCNRVYCIHVPGHDPITFSFRSFSFLIGWGFYGPII